VSDFTIFFKKNFVLAYISVVITKKKKTKKSKKMKSSQECICAFMKYFPLMGSYSEEAKVSWSFKIKSLWSIPAFQFVWHILVWIVTVWCKICRWAGIEGWFWICSLCLTGERQYYSFHEKGKEKVLAACKIWRVRGKIRYISSDMSADFGIF